jgi:hypothetical protein
MRKLLIPTLVFVTCAVPALAQEAPKEAAAPKHVQTQDTPTQAQTQDTLKQKPDSPAAVGNRDDALVRNTQAIEQGLQTRLARAGYTDVEMIPTTFLVRAKGPDGNPVMLVVGPESLAGSNDAAPEQGSAGDDSSGRGGADEE